MTQQDAPRICPDSPIRKFHAALAGCLLVISLAAACRDRTAEKTATSVAPSVATTETVAEAEGDDPPAGEPTTMPDVANQDVVDAVRELQASGLEVDVQFVFHDGVPLGVTTPTDEHPGDTVHKGESIILSVSVRDPEKVGHFVLPAADRVRLSDATAAKLREIVAANK